MNSIRNCADYITYLNEKGGPEGSSLDLFYESYETIKNESYYKFRYAKINPVTAEKELETDYILTGAPYNSTRYAAVFDGKMYLLSPNYTISVCSLSGTLERTINLGVAGFWGFVILDGKLAIDCKLTPSGRRCIRYLDGAKTETMQHQTPFMPLANDEIKLPYCLGASGGSVYLMFRTDYLATINLIKPTSTHFR